MKKLFLFFAIIAVQNVCAETYRCTDANGKKVYSQIPCGDSAQMLSVEEPEKLKIKRELEVAQKKAKKQLEIKNQLQQQKELEERWLKYEQVRLQREQVEIQKRQAISQQNSGSKSVVCSGSGTSFTIGNGMTVGNNSMSCF